MGNNNIENKPHTNRTKRYKVFHIVGHVMVGVIFAVVFALAFAILVKFIWNSVMPQLFNFKTITFWQAFGIIILAKLLFGGFGSRSHDQWKKNGTSRNWHKPWHPTEDENMPPRWFDRDWKSYRKFWQDEGKSAFENYMNGIEKERNT